jgi:hypothetical protein
VFIKTLDEIKENYPQNNTKCTPNKIIFLPKATPHNVFSPISPCSTIMPTIIFHDSTNDDVQIAPTTAFNTNSYAQKESSFNVEINSITKI